MMEKLNVGEATMACVILGLVLGTTTLLTGCGSGSGSPYPVDADLARQTLKNVLESWQDGQAADTWRQHHPPVVVQDMDWLSGKKLDSFEILDGKSVDANLHCQVTLHLIDPTEGEREKTVTYLVGTSPQITVFRQVMP